MQIAFVADDDDAHDPHDDGDDDDDDPWITLARSLPDTMDTTSYERVQAVGV